VKLNNYIAILALLKHKNASYNSEVIAKIFVQGSFSIA